MVAQHFLIYLTNLLDGTFKYVAEYVYTKITAMYGYQITKLPHSPTYMHFVTIG